MLISSFNIYGRISDFYLRTMVKEADIIIKAEIIKIDSQIKSKYAYAVAKDVYKGSPKDTLIIQCNATWACDITNAKVGEIGLYFLSKEKGLKKTRKYLIAGRGRFPFKIKDNDTLINFNPNVIFPWQIVKNSIADTLSKEKNELIFLNRSVKTSFLIAEVIKQLNQPELIKQKGHFISSPDEYIDFFIKKNDIKNEVDLETLYDGIPRIENDKKVLSFIYGTDEIRDVESKEFRDIMMKIYPDYIFIYKNNKLINISRNKKR